MPRFLALYTMPAENVAAFRALPKPEQDAIGAGGLPAWQARTTAGAIADAGGMVGKTLRVSAAGIAPATNAICGDPIVQADKLTRHAEERAAKHAPACSLN